MKNTEREKERERGYDLHELLLYLWMPESTTKSLYASNKPNGIIWRRRSSSLNYKPTGFYNPTSQRENLKELRNLLID